MPSESYHSPGRNADIAIDVAAMSTDGGVLLYGIDEDEHERPTIPTPIQLAGAADRVGQIVATSISEVPYIDAREYPCPDDPSRGYLLIVVPPSPRAPHQVTVGQDLRFYGRGAKGNRRLTEGEVARLYERRQEWQQDREELLDRAIRAAPIPPQGGAGFLHGFVRPVVADRSMLERAIEAFGDTGVMHRALMARAGQIRVGSGYSPA